MQLKKYLNRLNVLDNKAKQILVENILEILKKKKMGATWYEQYRLNLLYPCSYSKFLALASANDLDLRQ